MVESYGRTWWTYVTCEFYRVVKLTNYDFLSPGWKIAIGSLSTSALAALKDLTCDQFRALFRKQPRRHLRGDILYISFVFYGFIRAITEAVYRWFHFLSTTSV